VTFCLEDAVPEHVRKRRSLKNETDTDVIAGYSEPPIREGVCLLNLPESARVVEDALLHFQGQRYDLHAWVVMPNHVHVVVSPHDGFALSGVLHSWKSFSANQINRMLGRKEKLWQAESFDHLVRSEDAYARFVAYTEQNPVRAGLCSKPDDWLFSSARYR
jgi:putative DNA methylase